jgi:hypothetical protein
MDVFKIHEQLIDDYRQFTEAAIEVREGSVRDYVRAMADRGEQWPAPFISLNPSFQSGGSVTDLVTQGMLHPECLKIFRVKQSREDQGTRTLTLHRHQTRAIEAAQSGLSYVLTTGTGSGKSLGYIIPIVDRVLRMGHAPGIKAIIVYPMNALANSQVGPELRNQGKEQAHRQPVGGSISGIAVPQRMHCLPTGRLGDYKRAADALIEFDELNRIALAQSREGTLNLDLFNDHKMPTGLVLAELESEPLATLWARCSARRSALIAYVQSKLTARIPVMLAAEWILTGKTGRQHQDRYAVFLAAAREECEALKVDVAPSMGICERIRAPDLAGTGG